MASHSLLKSSFRPEANDAFKSGRWSLARWINSTDPKTVELPGEASFTLRGFPRSGATPPFIRRAGTIGVTKKPD